MDQDLSLMEQLLNLNEAIEDLKFRRTYYVDKTSMQASSSDFGSSDWSISETDMYESSNELQRKYPSPSSLSLHSRLSRQYDSSDLLKMPRNSLTEQNQRDSNKNNISNRVNRKSLPILDCSRKTKTLSNGNSKADSHGDKDSCDSGIHEAPFSDELST